MPVELRRVPPTQRKEFAKIVYTDLIGPEYSKVYKKYMSSKLAECHAKLKAGEIDAAGFYACLASPDLKRTKIGPELKGVWPD
mgnify:CR=1 FL=1